MDAPSQSSVSVLVIGDPHFKIDNVMQSQLLIKNSLESIKQLHPDAVVVAGDVLHTHERLHITCLSMAIEWLRSISQISVLYLIIGNHDRRNNSVFLTEEHGFTALREWNNTFIVDKPLIATIKELTFAFCPYVYPGRFDEALSVINYSSCSAIFAHQEIRGAKMGAIISTAGDEWPEDRPVLISGHIHDFDQLQSNVIYVGTPRPVSHGESERKTISFFIFSNAHEKSFDHQRISLKLPGNRTVELPLNDKATSIINSLIKEQTATACNVELKETDRAEYFGLSRVRLIVHGTAVELRSLIGLQLLKELPRYNIKVVYRPAPLPPGAGMRLNAFNDKARPSLLGVLHQRIQGNPKLVQIYTEIFGLAAEYSVQIESNQAQDIVQVPSTHNASPIDVTGLMPKSVNFS